MEKEILKELQEALGKTNCHILNVFTISGRTIAMEIIEPFIEKLLSQQKSELLEKLPKEMNLGKTTDGEKFEKGWNSCRNEILTNLEKLIK